MQSSTRWYTREVLRKYARIQSNTTKDQAEFSSNPSRSANYTSNAKYPLQSYFRGLFETVALAQGTCIVSTKPFTKHFHTPFFFSSVNVAGKKTKHQLFSSMSINSQKVRDAAVDLPKALGKVANLVEIHVHLNRLCCELAQERGGMLTSKEKMCLVYLTETYFVSVRDRSDSKYWSDYREAVGGTFAERYRSNRSSFQDKVLTNYHMKKPRVHGPGSVAPGQRVHSARDDFTRALGVPARGG
ncbi:hypothetical protein KUCAC02_033053 [Chaenocephalus aceratus]|nr:hypothetical protein KUCAC02_033053 [Chaenocephalus aceratus]